MHADESNFTCTHYKFLNFIIAQSLVATLLLLSLCMHTQRILILGSQIRQLYVTGKHNMSFGTCAMRLVFGISEKASFLNLGL